MGMTQFGCGEKEYVAVRGAENIFARLKNLTVCAVGRAWSVAAAILEPCGAFEWISLFYLGISGGLMLIFHYNLINPALHITAHFAVFAAILLIVNSADLMRRSTLVDSGLAKTLRWFRDWYPQLVFLFCFEELRILVHLIEPAWRDSILIAFDYRLTGVYPAVWLNQFSSFWLNETMQIAYLSYFLFLSILGISIYHRRRIQVGAAPGRDPAGASALRAFWTVMTASIIGYSIGYLISIFFPIEAPFFAMRALHLPPLAGGAATGLINFIEGWGRVRGGAFPSAHVSGSFVALIGAWRYRRYLFWMFLPFFIGVCVSTIYGRYHYIADVFAGIAVGAVGFILAEKLMSVPGANPAEPKTVQEN
jgi:membrane-associated phospholipid phosphatase